MQLWTECNSEPGKTMSPLWLLVGFVIGAIWLLDLSFQCHSRLALPHVKLMDLTNVWIVLFDMSIAIRECNKSYCTVLAHQAYALRRS